MTSLPPSLDLPYSLSPCPRLYFLALMQPRLHECPYLPLVENFKNQLAQPLAPNEYD
jgi:hypothetical protein